MSTEPGAKLRKSTPEAIQMRNNRPTEDVEELKQRLHEDPRFNPPSPSVWKRVALIMFFLTVTYLALTMRMNQRKPQIVHADRYSSEHKFRPAASPIITETLKNGKTRVRGAAPTFRNYY